MASFVCFLFFQVLLCSSGCFLTSNSELLLPLPPGCCSQRCAPLHPAEDSVSCMTKLKTGVSISFYISVKFYKDHILIRASWSHLIVNLGPAKWLSVPATKSNNLSLFWEPLGGFSSVKLCKLNFAEACVCLSWGQWRRHGNMKKADFCEHVCNPSTWKALAVGSWIWSQPRLK